MIQNDLISMLASSVRSVILRKFKEAKYFFVILYCNLDASRLEHITLVIRCVIVGNTIKVKENCLEFLNVKITSGLGPFGELERLLLILI